MKASSEKQLPKRKRGFEPPTLALAKLHSAIELLPRAVIEKNSFIKRSHLQKGWNKVWHVKCHQWNSSPLGSGTTWEATASLTQLLMGLLPPISVPHFWKVRFFALSPKGGSFLLGVKGYYPLVCPKFPKKKWLSFMRWRKNSSPRNLRSKRQKVHSPLERAKSHTFEKCAFVYY